jgi:hypothetical protein
MVLGMTDTSIGLNLIFEIQPMRLKTRMAMDLSTSESMTHGEIHEFVIMKWKATHQR